MKDCILWTEHFFNILYLFSDVGSWCTLSLYQFCLLDERSENISHWITGSVVNRFGSFLEKNQSNLYPKKNKIGKIIQKHSSKHVRFAFFWDRFLHTSSKFDLLIKRQMLTRKKNWKTFCYFYIMPHFDPDRKFRKNWPKTIQFKSHP